MGQAREAGGGHSPKEHLAPFLLCSEPPHKLHWCWQVSKAGKGGGAACRRHWEGTVVNALRIHSTEGSDSWRSCDGGPSTVASHKDFAERKRTTTLKLPSGLRVPGLSLGLASRHTAQGGICRSERLSESQTLLGGVVIKACRAPKLHRNCTESLQLVTSQV